MKDEIKPLEAPAVAYINTSMAVQMHDFLLVKVSATKNAGVVKRKKHSYFYLRKSLKIYCKLTMRRSCAKIKAGARSVAGPALQPVMCVPVMWSHACLRVYTNLPPLSDPFAHCANGLLEVDFTYLVIPTVVDVLVAASQNNLHTRNCSRFNCLDKEFTL